MPLRLGRPLARPPSRKQTPHEQRQQTPTICPQVDFNARNEYEYIANYKALQEALNKVGVDKHVEVAKLVKARPLDNMEFVQWLKAYWDAHCGRVPADYDAAARRALCKTGDVRGGGAGSGAAAAAGAAARSAAPVPAAAPAAAGRLVAPVTAAAPVAAKRPPSARAAAPVAAAAPRAAAAAAAPRTAGARATSRAASDDGGASAAALEAALADAAHWRAAADAAAKEKDFYWGKLRAVELLCNTCPSVAVLRAVEDILYAPSQEDGERVLGEALAALEAQGLAVPAADGAAAAGPAAGEGEGDVAAAGEAAAGAGDAATTANTSAEPSAEASAEETTARPSAEDAPAADGAGTPLAAAPEVGCSA